MGFTNYTSWSLFPILLLKIKTVASEYERKFIKNK